MELFDVGLTCLFLGIFIGFSGAMLLAAHALRKHAPTVRIEISEDRWTF